MYILRKYWEIHFKKSFLRLLVKPVFFLFDHIPKFDKIEKGPFRQW